MKKPEVYVRILFATGAALLFVVGAIVLDEVFE